MRLPEPMPTRGASVANQEAARTQSLRRSEESTIEPAGCCLTVCAPLVGCHCVTESPFC